MAYAEDLKSFVLNGTCGFDPHPGHHYKSKSNHNFPAIVVGTASSAPWP
jgi:hypothetical protein